MTLYPKFWRQHFLGVELSLSFLAGACLIAWFKIGSGSNFAEWVVHGQRGAVYGTLASISGSMLGFVIASLTVVLGLSSSPALRIVRESKYYRQIWAIFTSSIKVLGLTTILWLTCMAIDHDGAPKPLLEVLAVSATFLACLRLARCIWVLERIIELLIAVVPLQDGDAERRLS